MFNHSKKPPNCTKFTTDKPIPTAPTAPNNVPQYHLTEHRDDVSIQPALEGARTECGRVGLEGDVGVGVGADAQVLQR